MKFKLLREDVMVDYYAATIEMLLEKCFFAKEQLNKEEALHAVCFLLGSVEKEAHRFCHNVTLML